MTVDDRSFRKALACFASGVTVVTAVADGEPVGVTVSAFSSLSLDPPLVLVCLDKRNRYLDAFRAGPFAVTILREDQREISMQVSSRHVERFDGVTWAPGPLGAPVIAGGLATLECAAEQAVDAGDHVILVGRVGHVESSQAGQPLLYFRGAYGSFTGL